MHRILGILLLVASLQVGTQVSDPTAQQGESPLAKGIAKGTASAQLESTYIHGTIDVVLSTKDGFVLATDSRATSGESHSDDAEKAFAIGTRAGCVIAGLTGSEMGMEGFRLSDAMGTHLTGLDQMVARENRPASAIEIARSFSSGLESVAGLLLPIPQPQPGIVGAVSAVSISPEGEPEWVTFYLPIDVRSDEASRQYYYTTGSPIYLYYPEILGLRFDIVTLGFPEVVEKLVKANGPTGDFFSASPIMSKFYLRKQQHRLDDFTLEEAIGLAKTLVAATIASAPAQAGVGGPIDILTVTKDGVRWVQKKERMAPFPPPYRTRFFFFTLRRGDQALDGFECVRCTFRDVTLSYGGNGDVELLGPTFEGSCRLTILSGARRKMPNVVDRLKHSLASKCEITEAP